MNEEAQTSESLGFDAVALVETLTLERDGAVREAARLRAVLDQIAGVGGLMAVAPGLPASVAAGLQHLVAVAQEGLEGS